MFLTNIGEDHILLEITYPQLILAFCDVNQHFYQYFINTILRPRIAYIISVSARTYTKSKIYSAGNLGSMERVNWPTNWCRGLAQCERRELWITVNRQADHLHLARLRDPQHRIDCDK